MGYVTKGVAANSRWTRRDKITLAIVLALVAGFLAAMVVAVGTTHPVVAVEDAGELVSVTKNPSVLFESPTWTVRTTTHELTVNRTVSAAIGAKCRIETTSDTLRWLVIDDGKVRVRIL